MMPKKTHRAATWAAVVGILGWLIIIGTYLWWTLQPVDLTSVIEPIPILNENNAVAIGDPIVMELVVDKPEGLRTIETARLLRCASGNLVTLTSSSRDLPPGQYTIISDSVQLPAKVNPGDACSFVFRISYQVNPIRVETMEFTSEPFSVHPAIKPPTN
jgi:hypothetical protein